MTAVIPCHCCQHLSTVTVASTRVLSLLSLLPAHDCRYPYHYCQHLTAITAVTWLLPPVSQLHHLPCQLGLPGQVVLPGQLVSLVLQQLMQVLVQGRAAAATSGEAHCNTSEHSSSSSRSALALLLLALQHSHIAPEVTYIHIRNIYIYILHFGIIDWLVFKNNWFTRASVVLLLHRILLCARVVALSEKGSIIQ